MSETYLEADAAEAALNSTRSVAHLVQIQLSTSVNITNYPRDIAYGGDTYLSLGRLISVGKVTQDMKMSTSRVTVNLSGADQSLVSAFLSEPIANKRVEILLGYPDPVGGWLSLSGAPNPFKLFSGFLDTFALQEGFTSGKSTITLGCVNHWIAFDRVNGRRLNNDEQQRLHVDDRGLEFTSKLIDDLRWGKSDV